jgi:diguanylate cyclase (GGDEF)-like protein/PAS domain S-box-containing protein
MTNVELEAWGTQGTDARPRKKLSVPAELQSLGNLGIFRFAFDCANIGMGLVDRDGRFFKVNPKLTEILGFTREDLEGKTIYSLSAPGDRSPTLECLRAMLETGASQAAFEDGFLDKDGKALLVEVSCGMARSASGKPMYFVVSFRDDTERNRLLSLLQQQASVDPLTGVLNRMRLEERGTVELTRSERHGRNFSMVLIDLDRFKRINDSHGHAAGDLVLIGFCDIAMQCLRTSDLLGRWGGEEFVILLPETSPGEALLVAERLRAAIEAFQFPNGIRVTASMGIAGRRPCEDFSSLTKRADAAMYRAKQAGRNRVAPDNAEQTESIPT